MAFSYIDTSIDEALSLDAADQLKEFQNYFYYPKHQGEKAIYFCGNSLGLQPKGAQSAINQVLEKWQTLGVEGHFEGDLPWVEYHKILAPILGNILGAKAEEVAVMNTLTVNLHLLLVSFYRPTKSRYKIIMEGGAFPSDQYAVQSQVTFHGFNSKEAIIEIHPRAGEVLLQTDDILKTIEQHGAETALILFGGVNYYTGQFYDLEAITKKGHEVGAKVGFDLAHAIGNVPLGLHHYGADFAMWCSYKYLNSGPGSLGGIFIHERYADMPELPRFAGWWGHDEKRRFLMEKDFVPMYGAEGWQLSNLPILALAPQKASLSLFKKAGMFNLRLKSMQLTGYLAFLIQQINEEYPFFDIITPSNPEERGCQLSIAAKHGGKDVFHYLIKHGVILDWREPNVFRVAPTPMYNTFEEVWKFADLLKQYAKQTLTK